VDNKRNIVASHFRPLPVKEVRKETEDCVSVAFDVPEAWQEEFQFKQGQNITIRMQMNGEEIRRSYSICSSPLDHELRIAVKKVPQGKFSSFANIELAKNDILEVLPPTGRFYTPLDPSRQKNYLAFAAGSGITPVISIIKTTLAMEPRSNFTLVYSNRNRSSIIFKEQLEALKNKYMARFSLHYLLSREKTDAPIYHGRIDEKKCAALFEKIPALKNTDEYFICGPEQMIFTVKQWLEGQNIDKNKIHFELFTVPGQKINNAAGVPIEHKHAEEKISNISVKLDGISFEFDLPYDGLPILDAALQQGADLPFSCKGGVCATCRARLLEGKVQMDNNYALEPEELEAGFILTCQSHPRTEKVRIDFDVRG